MPRLSRRLSNPLHGKTKAYKEGSSECAATITYKKSGRIKGERKRSRALPLPFFLVFLQPKYIIRTATFKSHQGFYFLAAACISMILLPADILSRSSHDFMPSFSKTSASLDSSMGLNFNIPLSADF